MKRLSKEKRQLFRDLLARVLRRRSRRTRRKQGQDRKVARMKTRRMAEQFRKPGGRRVMLPAALSLLSSSARQKLIDKLTIIREYLVDERVHTVTLDFAEVETLHPCGTLLFVAEIERLLSDSACAQKMCCTYPQNSVVEQLFQHIGLLQKLGLPPRIEKIEAENVIVWLYEIGNEGNLDAIVNSLPDLLKFSGNKALRMAVTSGMTEAVANSAEHAYIHRRKDGIEVKVPHRWWIFARQEEEDISVSICDLGIGIPRSLSQTFPEELATFLKTRTGRKRRDHQMIELALTVGRSRTNKGYRGQGLKDILRVVKEQQVGRLKIYSNKGVYSFDGRLGQGSSYSEASSIMGTIVQWRIPLTAFNA